MKKIFSSLSSKKYLTIALVAVLALGVFGASTGMAMAQVSGGTGGATPTQTPDLFECFSSGSLGTCIVYIVTYTISGAIGVFVSLGGWLIQLGLQFSSNVYNSPIVQNGFGVVLSLANLGFVLAIIIIAIATILRSETYGYKKALWRLVAMAILVNFGLVITAPIVNFADSISTYFVTQIDSASGLQGSGNAMLDAVNVITADFNPGTATQAPAKNSSDWCASALNAASYTTPVTFFVPVSWIKSFCNTVTGKQGTQSPATTFSQAVLSMIFTIVLQLTIVISFFSIAILLLIRYIYLGLLLVVLPAAWLAWIFPGSESHFHKWWSNFIKWSFFSPAALFFIWLTLSINKVAYLQQVVNNTGLQNQAQSANSPVAGFVIATGMSIVPLGQLADDIILMGLLIGGLMMASHLTGKAGAFVVERAKGVSNGITRFAGKQAKKGARATYQRVGGKNLTARLQKGEIGALKYIPFARRAASYAGQGLSSAEKAGGERLVENEAKWAKEAAKNPKEGQNLLAGSLNTEKQIALIKALAENQDLDNPKQTVNGVPLAEYIAKNKKLIGGDYGQYKFYDKDLSKAMINAQANTEAAAVDAGTPDAMVMNENGVMVKAIDGLRDSMKNFVVKLKSSDVPKMDLNGMFHEDYLAVGANKVRMEMFLQKVAAYNPQLLPQMIKGMKGKQQLTLVNMYTKAIDKERDYQDDLTPATEEERIDRARVRDILVGAPEKAQRILSNLSMYLGGGGGGGTGPAAPAEPADH